MAALVEVGDVRLSEVDGGPLRGFSLERPSPGQSDQNTTSYVLDVEGWVLGREQQVRAIRGSADGVHVFDVPLAVERADIAASFPESENPAASGFRVRVNALRLPLEFELVLRAVLDDTSAVELARVRGRRAAVRPPFEPRLQPLILATLGRTGSNFLLWALTAHPGVVTFRPFQFEARVATYWMSVLMELSSPSSYVMQVRPQRVTSRGWWLGEEASAEALPDDLESVLSGDAVPGLAALCQRRIEAVYQGIAANAERSPAYFAEKFKPGAVPSLVHELYPGAREVVLVRDFRDAVCSMRSYIEKKGFERGFGGNPAEGEVDFVTRVNIGVSQLLREWKRRRGIAHLLRYEDLVLNPRQTLADLLDYLELPQASLPDMLRQVSELAPGMAGHRTTETAQASIGRWRQELSPELKQACDVFRPALEAFGYET